MAQLLGQGVNKSPKLPRTLWWSIGLEFIVKIMLFFLQFREILFVDEATGDKAFFTNTLGSALVAVGNYGTQLPELWTTGGGVANTSYQYQLLICDDTSFYSGFMISGYTQCYKRCDHWCGDYSSPYFRSASITFRQHYGGVAFNVNGARPLNNRLVSVGLRWMTRLWTQFPFIINRSLYTHEVKIINIYKKTLNFFRLCQASLFDVPLPQHWYYISSS